MNIIRNALAGPLATALLTAGLLAACQNSPDNLKTAEKVNADRIDSANKTTSLADSASVPTKQDAQFMVKAKSGNQLEVTLGELAQTNAQSPAVKRFGLMMVRDHSEGEKELRSMAIAKRIVMPDTLSNQQQKEADDLKKKTGHDFDKAYIDLMVDDHKEDIDEFTKAAQQANDPDIKALAAKMVPVLKEHYDSARILKRNGGR